MKPILVSLTEIDICLASWGSTDSGSNGDRAALFKGDKLVEMVQVGKHSCRNTCAINNIDDHNKKQFLHFDIGREIYLSYCRNADRWLFIPRNLFSFSTP